MVPPDLQCPGCGRRKYRKEDGSYLDYCSKSCRDAYLQRCQEAIMVPPDVQCPGCGKEKFRKEDGSYFDYCSKSCRDAYLQRCQKVSIPSPMQNGVQSTFSDEKCSLPGCNQRKRVESGIIHDFCRKSHAIKAREQEIYIRNIKPASERVFTDVSDVFQRMWAAQKGTCPAVEYIFVITNTWLLEKWQAYRNKLDNDHVEELFHGTSLTCCITKTKQLCGSHDCGICGISKTNFDRVKIGSNVYFKRFGHGFYLAPNSSKCHDYTQGANGYRAMLLCDVCPGKKYRRKRGNQDFTSPPQGYDSVHGITGGELNYEELTLFDPDAILPKFIVAYKRDGIQKLV